jgi:hypothetical protein
MVQKNIDFMAATSAAARMHLIKDADGCFEPCIGGIRAASPAHNHGFIAN